MEPRQCHPWSKKDLHNEKTWLSTEETVPDIMPSVPFGQQRQETSGEEEVTGKPAVESV